MGYRIFAAESEGEVNCQKIQAVHTHDLYDVDDCLEVSEVEGCHV